jgi:hypothetical protein
MEHRFSNLPRDYGLPFGWWGHRDDPPARRSIVQLLDDGVLDARVAAFLWLVLERRASVVVNAETDGVGKTTLLTALLDFLPPDLTLIYLRGWYERFEFLESVDPACGYMLCNEISHHLPTYLWGRGVRQMFEAMDAGFGMATTVHAANAAEVFTLLSAYPLEVPPALLGRIDLILTLGMGSGASGLLRRLMCLRLVRDDAAAGLPSSVALAERDVLLSPLQSRPGRLVGVLAERFGYDLGRAAEELARREQVLLRLQRDGVTAPDLVREAILAQSGTRLEEGEPRAALD